MSPNVETFEFQSEARQVLDLMIHSIYSNRDIFLRELVSNSSDALDKLRFEALTNEERSVLTADLHIDIEADAENKTISVIDNGIGMTRDEVIEYIGTIAKSGSQDFLKMLKELKDKPLTPELIGQFGVGFYSSFMVADKVSLITRKAGEEKGTKWDSAGDGTYTLEEVARDSVGTTVILHLKEGEEYENYNQEWKVREIISKYSDYVDYPIKMQIERTEIEKDEAGNPVEGGKEEKIIEDKVLNTMKAIWLRPEKEVPDEEYDEFYKHISHDWTPPLKRIVIKAEGRFEYQAVLYIPSQAPLGLQFPDGHKGVNLYIKRIFIMNDCKELIPEHLRFIRGVVDSEDLPLNISREILQKNKQVEMIRKGLVKKILDTLKEMQAKAPEDYLKFWNQFGKVMKEGIYQDHNNKEAILELAMFESTNSDTELTTLAEYMDRMTEKQEVIYYMTGEDRKSIENSPHLEAFKDKKLEVLFLTDPVDELWIQLSFEHKGKKLQSVGKGTVDLDEKDESEEKDEKADTQNKEIQPLLEAMKSSLEEKVKEVRISNRLTSSPACLVVDEMDMSPHLEQLLKASGQKVPDAKKILEVNPDHEILVKLKDAFEKSKDDPILKDYSELLYGQAVLAEGGQLPDPGGFSKLLSKLMAKAI
jgi:molecular chaperone HtpG